ncbi:hypothetical protein DSM43518_04056 [Mycobacterium marinum]|uniref:maleylpyruvate isomerase family mycothiol-dependent enzyme n=2 Tax=Mycobacterium marinum TaxID=1781 RepID=UPI000EE5A0F9|nr:maleylpyruvate isomerase family mycothiol-dependent enzyme [Mycobacterium marinum]RFZ05487.1 hypothetical protein DSM43518_04056 [Mycobacterium marinum]GJO11708.1 hypothetical protein NJB1808e29_48760 [Mycobacterium marinum]GJO13654.1 hypothetical protein NJB1907f34b_49460 [Mycobacterium marinum]GJO19822.1 hypothetical protein NJB1907E90_50090 [Mycobacterium marinum]GJO27151.1 hypothetical protein NJB1907E11_43280 [Mycobacterium marinum]
MPIPKHGPSGCGLILGAGFPMLPWRGLAVPSPGMGRVDYLAALRRDGDRIVSVSEAGLDRPVPSCAGWTIADLIWHVGVVHTFWRQVAVGAITGPETYQEPARPPNLVDWFRDGVAETSDALAGIDPAVPAWTWGRRQDVGFIRRRVAHETAVHCWDAVTAVGPEEPIESNLAADGVSEFIDDVLPAMSKDLAGPFQTISLRACDTDTQWTVRVGDGHCHAMPIETVADATVSATASDLVLLLWGRRRPDRVDVDGAAEALRRFLARATF